MPAISQIFVTRFSTGSRDSESNHIAQMPTSPQRPASSGSDTSSLDSIAALGRRWRLALNQFTGERTNTNTADTSMSPHAATTPSTAPASPYVTDHTGSGFSFMDIRGGWENLTKHASAMMDSVRENLPRTLFCCIEDSAAQRNQNEPVAAASNPVSPSAADLPEDRVPVVSPPASTSQHASIDEDYGQILGHFPGETTQGESNPVSSAATAELTSITLQQKQFDCAFNYVNGLSTFVKAQLTTLQDDYEEVLTNRDLTFTPEAGNEIRAAAFEVKLSTIRVANKLFDIEEIREKTLDGSMITDAKANYERVMVDAYRCSTEVASKIQEFENKVASYKINSPTQSAPGN